MHFAIFILYKSFIKTHKTTYFHENVRLTLFIISKIENCSECITALC